jgi:hypothetical protein
MTERAGTIRTRTTEKQLVEEGREMPRRRDELAAQKPLRAPRHHTPPAGSNSLGDKRSPVQIRAPRLEAAERCGSGRRRRCGCAQGAPKRQAERSAGPDPTPRVSTDSSHPFSEGLTGTGEPEPTCIPRAGASATRLEVLSPARAPSP